MKTLQNNCLLFFLIVLIGFAPFQSGYAINDGSQYAASSKLATGKWIKIKTGKENAVYKLTYEDIKKMGIEDPAKVNIYGYGGWILDENFAKSSYVDDLPEVSVYMNKGSDGAFGPGDYLLFFGRGTIKWTLDGNEYVHENNPYAEYGCYFLTQGERGPKEMPEVASEGGNQASYSVFDDYALHENDWERAHDANSGRELFGESFLTKRNYPVRFSMPGITSSEGLVRMSFAAKSTANLPFSLTIDGESEPLISYYVSPVVGANSSYVRGQLSQPYKTWTGAKPEEILMDVACNGSSTSFASLNFVRINVERDLKFYNKAYMFFRKKESKNQSGTYVIKSASSNLLVFDVTGNFEAKQIQTVAGTNELSFGTNNDGTLHEYVLVDPLSKSFPVPVSLGEVKNQNLHALPQTDMVIIVPEYLRSYAEQLAEEHRKRDGLRVTVALPAEIYNEFSSGVYDATAYRRFMKMFYDRAGQSETERPSYLLLFGDGVFENRFIISECQTLVKDNFLLTYQMKESLNEQYSYGTDDYFGLLDDAVFNLGNSKLALGIGRFPVRTAGEAEKMIKKIVNYMDNKDKGPWKNNVCFASDDIDRNVSKPSFTFIGQADELAEYMQENHPEYMTSKVYMDAYKKSSAGGQGSYPDANIKLNDIFKSGCFLFDYTGHGSVSDLSAEHMVNKTDIAQMTFTHLPLWITATCDYSWFDNLTTSAGEEVFLKANSGAIALISTTRVVDASPNAALNRRLVKNLFRKDENGKYPRLGDVLRESKNDLGGMNQLNYVLLGDPALRLNYPTDSVGLQTVNGEPADTKVFNFKAKEQITLTGVVVDASGNVDTEFNGSVQTAVFDTEQELKTVALDYNGDPFPFNEYTNKVVVGKDTVINGTFTAKFMVPIDISYSEKLGKISFYASDLKRGVESSGYFLKFYMDGSIDNGTEDNQGPEIRTVYLNTPEFKPGGTVNATPYFVAEVYDENGINMSGSSLGHDITISIDNSPFLTYNLNHYFVPNSGGIFGEGTVRYSIPELPAGKHTLVFRVWDLLNNSSTDSLEFVVDPALKPQIFDLIASPNPAQSNTTFILRHDRPETPLSVGVTIYDMTGRRIWSYETNAAESIEWNLQSESGGRVQPGVYLYKASVRSATSNEAIKAKKIIVLGQ